MNLSAKQKVTNVETMLMATKGGKFVIVSKSFQLFVTP